MDIEGIYWNVVSNDANLYEIIAIMEALKWLGMKGCDDCIMLTDYMVAVAKIS